MPPLLIVALGAFYLAAIVTAVLLSRPENDHARVARSLAAIERNYHGTARAAEATDEAGGPGGLLGLAARFAPVGRLLSTDDGRDRLRQYLDRAGNPGDLTVEDAVALKGAGLVGGAVGGMLFGSLFGGVGAVLTCLAVAAPFGFFLPDLLLYNRGVKRQQELQRSLPDVLDTLVIGVEAGQAFDAALARVAHHGKGPMVDEAARVLHEMRIGKSRVEAMRALSQRTTVPELQGFVTAVIQASDLGIPIANVLREQSREMRLKRWQRAEEQAQKVPVKLLFPTMLCLMPALFVLILGPGLLAMTGAL